nr:MAG TPA: hypothetical protein [Caudoviricetes sp.]
MIIKASFPLTVFNFASHKSIASFNCLNGCISSKSYFVIDFFG